MAGKNAYVSRKLKKRDFRSLWISRLNAALKAHGVSYSRFIFKLTRKQVGLNRKMLSELAIHEPKVFEEVVKLDGPRGYLQLAESVDSMSWTYNQP